MTPYALYMLSLERPAHELRALTLRVSAQSLLRASLMPLFGVPFTLTSRSRGVQAVHVP